MVFGKIPSLLKMKSLNTVQMLSVRTVRHKLQAFGPNARIPRKKPFLSRQQRRERFKWTTNHVNWTEEQQWDKVVQ
ncbi:hypothetical protein JGF25_23405, partial [Salmonella enterica subsp. enterica serovar Mbandaka]|nr:hypothetical protein [Salmonella enterica subsp. enterica serovar Mbandaka]